MADELETRDEPRNEETEAGVEDEVRELAAKP